MPNKLYDVYIYIYRSTKQLVVMQVCSGCLTSKLITAIYMHFLFLCCCFVEACVPFDLKRYAKDPHLTMCVLVCIKLSEYVNIYVYVYVYMLYTYIVLI